SYLKLRSGFLREFKSMSALFQRCQPAPEVGLGRSSADEQESDSGTFQSSLIPVSVLDPCQDGK
ncbi:hypothetical protein, partial [Lactiplantibacillus pentosus]|uniref:hypothetical protein n=1 Tax=Lactiplantibacillus pentosus TaxID=1589 RepID=UPI0021A55420